MNFSKLVQHIQHLSAAFWQAQWLSLTASSPYGIGWWSFILLNLSKMERTERNMEQSCCKIWHKHLPDYKLVLWDKEKAGRVIHTVGKRGLRK
jgi:hypothetical protein